MTLKELISKCDPKEVANFLYWRFEEIDRKERADKEKLTEGVKNFLKTLEKPSEEETFDLVIQMGQDMFGKSYVNVSMRNNDFVCDPPEGLNPWGGNCEDREDCKEGYYNVNWNGYQRLFGIGGESLRNNQFYEGEIIFENCSRENFYNDEGILYEIIWELTFYGWDDEERVRFFKSISE